MVQAVVTLANGKIDGPATIKLRVGQTLALTIVTDRAVTVHAHGFEVEQELKAGGTATLTLKATPGIVGAWPVEDDDTD